MATTKHTVSNGFCTTCGETEEWLRETAQAFEVADATPAQSHGDSLYASRVLNMTVPELRKHAKSMGHVNTAGLRRGQLLDLLGA